MKRLTWLILIIMVFVSVSGCTSRAKRIANDIDWVVFDGEPSKDN